MTENGTASGYPTVSNATGSFYNQSMANWAHHWSQFISSARGFGIMFRDSPNEKLYYFDSIAGSKTGALNVSSSTGQRRIEFLPVSNLAQVSNFMSALDIIWYGAVATFDATTPIYNNYDQTGLWMIVEYPPAVAVITENYQ